jgi:hypothetical protein
MCAQEQRAVLIGAMLLIPCGLIWAIFGPDGRLRSKNGLGGTWAHFGQCYGTEARRRM